MSARNHKKSGNEWTNSGSIIATGNTINVSIPAGRKGLVICASISQANHNEEAYQTPSTPTVKYGGSSGASFTNQINVTIQHRATNSSFMEARATLYTYAVPEGDSGTKAIYTSVTNIPSDSRILIYLLYGSQYVSSVSSSGTDSYSNRNSTLNLGGYIIGQVYHVDSTPAITEYNGAVIVSAGNQTYTSNETSITFMDYIKIGAQSKTVNGGGTWVSSKKYIHARVAFNALGKEYNIATA